MQTIGILVLVAAGFAALFGTLVLAWQARRWRREEGKRADLEDLVRRGRAGRGDVATRADRSFRIFIRTAEGWPLEVIVHDTAAVEVLAERALHRLQEAEAARRRAAPEDDDGPPSGLRAARLVAVQRADGRAALALDRLHARADPQGEAERERLAATERQRRLAVAFDRTLASEEYIPPVLLPLPGGTRGQAQDHAS